MTSLTAIIGAVPLSDWGGVRESRMAVDRGLLLSRRPLRPCWWCRPPSPDHDARDDRGAGTGWWLILATARPNLPGAGAVAPRAGQTGGPDPMTRQSRAPMGARLLMTQVCHADLYRAQRSEECPFCRGKSCRPRLALPVTRDPIVPGGQNAASYQPSTPIPVTGPSANGALPASISRAEMDKLAGWDKGDIVLVTATPTWITRASAWR